MRPHPEAKPPSANPIPSDISSSNEGGQSDGLSSENASAVSVLVHVSENVDDSVRGRGHCEDGVNADDSVRGRGHCEVVASGEDVVASGETQAPVTPPASGNGRR